jgi:hypothetical protein
MDLAFTKRLTEMSTRNLPGARAQSVENLIAICELIVHIILIWGVCILLRVWYRMMWVLIRLRNVTIVG